MPHEILKYCLSALLSPLTNLFRRSRDSQTFSKDSATSLKTQNGDQTICANYRGISLVDIRAKVFVTVLLNRFVAVRDTRSSSTQNGFRRGKLCAD